MVASKSLTPFILKSVPVMNHSGSYVGSKPGCRVSLNVPVHSTGSSGVPATWAPGPGIVSLKHHQPALTESYLVFQKTSLPDMKSDLPAELSRQYSTFVLMFADQYSS